MWQLVVILNVGLASLVAVSIEVVRAVRLRRVASWLATSTLLLTASVAAFRLQQPIVTSTLLAAFLVFEWLALFAVRRLERRLDAGHLPAARRWARLAVLVHPFPRSRARLSALSAHCGVPGARESAAPRPLAALFLGVWEGHRAGAPEAVIASVEQVDTSFALEVETLRRRYVEAVGLVRGAEGIALLLERREVASDGWTRLQLAAFAGRPDLVRRFFEGPFRGSVPAERHWWTMVAGAVSGDAKSEARLAALVDDATMGPRARALRGRLRPSSEVASATVERALRAMSRWLSDEAAFGLSGVGADHWLPWATWAVVLGNLAFFALEIRRGGCEDEIALDYVGVLMPWRVAIGERWRMFTFWWMHFGWLHLAMNLLGLLSVGPYVERRLGRTGFVAVHALSALAGGLWAVERYVRDELRGASVYVGASGGVLGLVGAVAAINLHGWLVRGSRTGRKLFLRTMLLFALGTACDQLIPEVSGALHAIGAVVGFLVASAAMGLQAPPVLRLRRRLDEGGRA